MILLILMAMAGVVLLIGAIWDLYKDRALQRALDKKRANPSDRLSAP